MQWNQALHAGFSTAEPWLPVAADFGRINVESARGDPASMLTYYRQMLAFRRGHAVWGTGDVRLVSLDASAVVAFFREDAEESYLVVVNLSDEDQDTVATEPLPAGASGKLVFGDGALDTSAGTLHVKLAGTAAAVFQVR